SWTFYLRKGQRFHNGDPVTAHDVKFSLERVMSPESISSGAAALRRAVDRIEVVDDLTVRVYTKGVIPQFAASLSRAVFMEGSVMPKKYIETVGAKGFRDKPVGSGPWKFVQSVPGDRIEYEAVTYPHWRGTPQFKRLTLLLVPEQSTRLAMVRTGEAAIGSIGPEAVKEARAGGMKIVSVPGTMQAVYQFWGLYRPEAEAGPRGGLRFASWNTALPGTPFMVPLGEAVAGFWEKVGVKVEMKTVEWGAFDPMGRGEQKGLVGAASMYRTAGRPEPIPRYATTFVSKGVQHLFGDPQNCPALCVDADKAYEAIVSEKDDAKRTAATNRMIELVAKSWIAVPIVEGMGTWAVNPKSVGY